ncbi:MAG: PQQ-binding-like beta-propeller repeat protein [Planctomycetales bacterium]|nr:PQQ-binding-like beta-propeller repeat protein [Planctomycetales bacterium]
MRFTRDTESAFCVLTPLLIKLVLVGAVCVVLQPRRVVAEDWPMWRYDSHRSAASPNRIPSQLQLLWKRTFSSRKQAWDDPLNLDLMTYDRTFEPVVKDGRMFLGFNDQDKLLALEAATGRTLWTFYANGPIRMAPVADQDRVLVCSDDGYLYCLSAASGQLRWKFSAAPNNQKALGNQRIVSAWPARGGPVVRDGTVYFANSIWPFMGTFICALNVESGKVQWINDSTGSIYIKQPHSAPAFAGVAPQGMLAATEKDLVVPGGRSVPAVFDRLTGELRYFHLNEGGKGTGGSFVALDESHFFVHTRERGTRAFDLESGDKTAFMPNEPVIAGKTLFAAVNGDDGKQSICAYSTQVDHAEDREPLWQLAIDGRDDLILAGQHLVAAGSRSISVIALEGDLQSGEFTGGQLVQELETQSPVTRLLVASNLLFAVTQAGEILAYGSTSDFAPALASATESDSSANVPVVGYVPTITPETAAKKVYQLLTLGNPQGYAYWYGACELELAAAWAKISPFEQLAIVDESAERVAALRARLDQLQAYGKVTAHVSTARDFLAPEYTGQMTFVGESLSESLSGEDLQGIYKSVRPYGGKLILLGQQLTADRLAWLESLELERADFRQETLGLAITRVGALPGSADWTHQYGDVANSIKSDDSRVKLPLGILWFGGSSNLDVLPRHGHGPPQQVIGGRLFIEGMSSLSARDVYTGRVLWTRNFGDLGNYDVYYDSTYEDAPLNPMYNQVHIPGANGRGTNYVVTEDRVYLVQGNRCLILDPETGDDLGEIKLPPEPSGETAEWGYIAVYEDVLLGGLGFAMYRDRYSLKFESDDQLKSSRQGFGSKSLDRAASRALIGFNRFSGEQLWRVDALHSFWHNGIVAGGERVYCLDRNPKMIEEALQRRGLPLPDTYRIVALDARNGQVDWEVKESITGSWLGYSKNNNLLLQAGAQASDRLYDEIGQGMRVYNANDGTLRWSKDDLKYSGPCVLHNDLIITNANSYSESAGAFDIHTGEQWMIKNPITGKVEPWKITRAYGCNSIIASENLLTFRSGAAGYYDLLSDSGTGNLGGFRSGCTSNLIAANGVLNAPDYTRTCSCSYQNQTSLALVPMPNVEAWSVHQAVASGVEQPTPVDTLGLNFGAPGDHRAPDGTLWVEHPTVSGEPLSLAINLDERAQPFRRHVSALHAAVEDGFDWVYASGLQDVSHINVDLMLKPKNQEDKTPVAKPTLGPAGEYDIEIFFAAPDKSPRTFDVILEGTDLRKQIVLSSALDDDRVSHCEFKRVAIDQVLSIRLEAVEGGSPVINGLFVRRNSK